jgi:hypothetical protein
MERCNHCNKDQGLVAPLVAVKALDNTSDATTATTATTTS